MPHPGATLRRWMASVVAVGAVAVLAAPLFRPPQPVALSSFPADGAVLPEGPAEVRLDVPAPPAAGNVHVNVVDRAGTTVVAGRFEIDDTEIAQPLQRLTAGAYRTVYHVILPGGAELTGSSTFFVGAAADAGPGPDRDEALRLAGGTESSAHHHGAAIDPLTATVLAANVAVLLGIAVVEIRRRRSPPPD
jgi:methionine-rich copper-binding protein CopC